MLILVDWIQPGAFSSADAIEVTTMEQLLHNICLLLSSRTREIVKAGLGFIKVILFIMDPKTLASHATVMVGIDIIIDTLLQSFLHQGPFFGLLFTFIWSQLC